MRSGTFDSCIVITHDCWGVHPLILVELKRGTSFNSSPTYTFYALTKITMPELKQAVEAEERREEELGQEREEVREGAAAGKTLQIS